MPWGQEGEQARLALRAIELRYLLLPTGLAITGLVSSSQLFRHEVSYELHDRLGSRGTSRSSCDPSAAFLVMAQDIPQRESDMTSIDKNSLSQGIWDSPMAFQV